MPAPASPDTRTLLRLSDLPSGAAVPFRLEPDAETRAEIAKRLGLLALKKLRFTGQLSPLGKADWQLDAEIGATVTQACIVPLDPVVTRIDDRIDRRYIAGMAAPDQAGEFEMPEDDGAEPLPDTLDLDRVMEEALALALPDYPRSPDAELTESTFTEPGKTPMSDDDTRPFAGLEALRDKLADKE